MAITTPPLIQPRLQYLLNDPGFTIYHRAALGGLAATVLAWKDTVPHGIVARVTTDMVEISWGSDLTDQDALKKILAASFKLTPEKVIDLPGLEIGPEREDLRMAVHNGIMQTFLQHRTSKRAEEEARKFALQSVDEGESSTRFFSYKAVDSYAHQTAKGANLFDEKLNGGFPDFAKIGQSVIPGACSGASAIRATAQESILLLYLVVGCAIFQLRPRSRELKAQSCIVIPDVTDLIAFSKALNRMAGSSAAMHFFSNTFIGRVVGGAEEAALRFLIDLQTAEEITTERSVSGCQAIAMGKVAWDPKQMNRSLAIRVKGQYPEIDVFKTSVAFLGQGRIQISSQGDSFIVPTSSVPELIASNLAMGQHWCAHFRSLVADKKDFKYMLHNRRGLVAMKESIKDANDQAVIRAFQDAWRRTMGAIYERATDQGLDSDRLLDVEREKMRNAILRCKTADMLAGWFLRFCADATKGGSLQSLRGESMEIREFIFNPRNFERFQNLCLFAMVSYESKSATV